MFKSATLVGFYLPAYTRHFQKTMARLCELVETGKLKVTVDPSGPYKLETAADAVEHLQSGKSVGKVVVKARQLRLQLLPRALRAASALSELNSAPIPARLTRRLWQAAHKTCPPTAFHLLRRSLPT